LVRRGSAVDAIIGSCPLSGNPVRDY